MLKKSLIVLFSILICTIFLLFKAQKHIPAAPKDDDHNNQTIFYKGIMPSEKVLDFPVDCNTLTGSVNL